MVLQRWVKHLVKNPMTHTQRKPLWHHFTSALRWTIHTSHQHHHGMLLFSENVARFRNPKGKWISRSIHHTWQLCEMVQGGKWIRSATWPDIVKWASGPSSVFPVNIHDFRVTRLSFPRRETGTLAFSAERNTGWGEMDGFLLGRDIKSPYYGWSASAEMNRLT